MDKSLFQPVDRELLLRLLRTPTVGPLETAPDDQPPLLWEAQRDFTVAAEAIGMNVVHHASPLPETALREDVPVTVRKSAKDSTFLAQQPSLVLRLGPDLPAESSVMFNVHLDTVSGLEPVDFDGARFTGRGAIDAKGPAVALLAGVRDARANNASIGRDVGVLIQVVSGEEGGAMGTFGTRPLVESGFYGRLNIFCEPTGLRYLPRATASMTACLRVEGDDAIDDHPDAGHNATVLLGFLVQHLAKTLDSGGRSGRTCLAGVHTGTLHNRVYGRGRLLLNLSYASSTEGAELEKSLADAVDTGIRAFAHHFADTREFARTARDAAGITRLEWHKRGLPSLNNSDPWAQALLADAGVARWPDDEPAFTCDAIWMDGIPETFTAVLGPGSLDANNAHAQGEFAPLADLEGFASTVSRLLTRFANDARESFGPRYSGRKTRGPSAQTESSDDGTAH
jgi:acetylornithine deacetylase/succinyl-diaminopimelate desuccinylase-like protein